MGYKWEVMVWAEVDGIYGYYSIWYGNSLYECLLAFICARKNYDCVNIIWRRS